MAETPAGVERPLPSNSPLLVVITEPEVCVCVSGFDLFTIIMCTVDSDNLQSLLAHVILGGEMLNNIPSLPGAQRS